MATITIKPCGGGVVKDIPPSELAANQWSDALNMRFFNQIAQRRGGIREGGWTTPLITPYALETFVTSTGTRFLVEAGLAKVYVDDGSTQTEITRYTAGVTISTMTAVGTTVTVTTSSNHGRSNGDLINVWDTTETAYNVSNKAITVTGVTTFTYVADSAPAAPASVVGKYELRVIEAFTGAIDDKWTISVLGGILILNNPVDGPYYWNGDTALKMRRLPGWATGEKCYAMRSFKNFLIAMAPTTGGTFYPHQIKWSTSVEAGSIPTTWTAAATNDAGDTPQSAEVGGFLVDGLGLGEEFIAYKDDGIFALSYIGGNDVFSLRKIPGRFGLRTRHAIVETPHGHVFLSNGDLRLHAGGVSKSIIEGKIRHWINRSIDGGYSARAFLALNAAWSEVWLVFPSNGATVPNTVCAWNWNDDTWAIFEIPPTTCAATGLIADGVDSESWDDSTLTWETLLQRWYEYLYSPNELRLILGMTGPKLGLADTGSDDLGTAITWRLEKRGSALDDNDSMKVVSRSRPQFTSTAGAVVSCYHATTTEASDEPSYGTVVSYTIGTSNWVNRFSKAGRFLHVKYEGSSSGAVVLRSYDVEFNRQGRF
jgi:hypothetical protein